MAHARIRILAPVLVAASLAAGCLVKDTDHTLCLEPDGSVTWTVIDRDVHATGDTPAVRQQEEDEYLAKARLGQHPAAVAFGVLHAFDVRTDIVRDAWPFSVGVQARFPDLGQLWQDFLNESGLPGESRLQRGNGQVTWTLMARMDEAGDGPRTERAQALDALFDGNAPRLFLRHGRFVGAAGFEISDDDRVATLKEDLDEETVEDETGSGGQTVRLSLTWTGVEATKAANPQR